jgi:NADH-quinone oxidoreductase subunit M
LLTPLALKASVKSIKHKTRTYIAAFLILETMMIGTFCSLDIVYFYIFFESVLIPMFLIIGIWGGERRIYSAFKFFLYTLLGSVLMLIAMIIMVQESQTTHIPLMQNFVFENSLQTWLWLAFFASFAVKVPMFPFHTWLPDAHVEAPTAGSVILAGILLKMGGYGFVRFSLPLFPEASQLFAPLVYTLSVVGVIYTSVVALVQTDMKKLIAYSSVAHMGIVTFGLFSFKEEGIQGAIFQMISHGLVSAALFLCVGVLYDRIHSREITRYGGVAKVMPLYAIAFMIFTFGSIGLPGTSGFVGEILVLISAFSVGGLWAATLGLGMILGAAYALWLYSRVMLNKLEKEDLKKLPDLTSLEKTCFIPLLSLILLLGFYPKPLLDLTHRSVQKLIKPFHESTTLLTDASFDFLLGDKE